MKPCKWTLPSSASGIRRYVLSMLIQLLFALGQTEAMAMAPEPDLFASNGGGHSQTATLISAEREDDTVAPAGLGSPDILAAAGSAFARPRERACQPALPGSSNLCVPLARSNPVRAPPFSPLA